MKKSLAHLYSTELLGVTAKIIDVEADINVGLHSFNIVGLADRSLNEAKERVNSSLKNSGMRPPNRENRKITINLAPAHIKKTGSHYDLAIALGYLVATGQMRAFDPSDKIFLGELGLDGTLRSVKGVLNSVVAAATKNFRYAFVPAQNANEAAALLSIKAIPVSHLREAIALLEGKSVFVPSEYSNVHEQEDLYPDISEVRGQEQVKRALLIAASGEHNILMSGPPGVGKSFLAQALPGIMPPLAREEAIEVTSIWSAAGLAPDGLIFKRPFRSPHHTASLTSFVGGGQDPKPGEMSLAHRGILFLDELPEFPRNLLESLRAPMESGVVHVARTKRSFSFPARFLFAAAMNPCPCGYYGDRIQNCSCTPHEIVRYQKRISGPLLDRIDIQMNVQRVPMDELRANGATRPISPVFIEKIAAAREHRFFRKTHATRERFAPDAEIFLSALEKKSISPRGYHRLLAVARTIADLDEKEDVSASHLAEAFAYRIRTER